MSIHTNHPKEATHEVREACAGLPMRDPLGNLKSVLLRGVNDDARHEKLVHKLLMMRVRTVLHLPNDPRSRDASSAHHP